MIRNYYLRVSTLLVNHSIALLVVLHVVGLIGLLSPYQHIFRQLTPLTLIFSSFILLINHRNISIEFIIFSIGVFILGFAIEYIGVHSGQLFGYYEYGQTLGFKIDRVPVIIGVNWFLIIYCVAVLTDSASIPTSLKIIVGALLAVAIDFLIEPVAIRFDFWSWQGNLVPIQNYIGWFFTSVIMLVMYHALKVKAESRLALPYYFVQIFFFLFLNLFL